MSDIELPDEIDLDSDIMAQVEALTFGFNQLIAYLAQERGEEE